MSALFSFLQQCTTVLNFRLFTMSVCDTPPPETISRNPSISTLLSDFETLLEEPNSPKSGTKPTVKLFKSEVESTKRTKLTRNRREPNSAVDPASPARSGLKALMRSAPGCNQISSSKPWGSARKNCRQDVRLLLYGQLLCC
jgi:hypothetical protein